MTTDNYPTGYTEPVESTYDGRWCVSQCRSEGCDHQERWDEQEAQEEDADFTGSSDEIGYAPDR